MTALSQIASIFQYWDGLSTALSQEYRCVQKCDLHVNLTNFKNYNIAVC